MKIINAEGLLIGRVGTVVAKAALLGEDVVVYNCDKAMISGKSHIVLGRQKQKKDFGTHKGPFYFREPFRFVKRVFRGMVPYKQPRGRAAFERIKCYDGEPEEFKGKGMTIEGASYKKLPNRAYLTITQITKEMGGKQ